MFFRVLGPLRVEHEGIALAIPGARLRLLLAGLLVSANQDVAVDRLTALVWADRPPATALSSLHNQVLRLRRLLGGADRLRTGANGYRLVVARDELDLTRFLDGYRRGCAAYQRGDWSGAAEALDAANALWFGEALADLPEREALREVASVWAEQRLHALECRIEADIELGRATEVSTELSTLLTAHPLRERFHLLAVLANDRAGRRVEALAAYRRARAVLAEELGVEPGRELQRLHQRILAADDEVEPAPATAPSAEVAQLPPDLADFTGRRAQVEQLTALLTGRADGLAPRATVVAAVTGTGGIGKTSLAVRVAHRVAAEHPDGQLYVDLRGNEKVPRRPEDVLAEFLRDLDGPATAIPDGLTARAARFRSLLAGRRVLLLLDNARDAAQVRPLLPGSGGCGVLVTSRNRLAGLTGATPLDLTVLSERESADLFAGIVGRSRTGAEPEATRAVLDCCAGLPLAVRIAAARLASRPTWTIESLADRLAHQRGVLDELRVEDVAVRTSFLLSYDNIADPVAARSLRLLSLVDVPELSLPAAAALIGLAEPAAALIGTPETDAETVLEALVDANLVEEPSPGCYRLHDLLRLCANEKALAEDSAAVRTAAVTSIARWCLLGVAEADRVLVPQFHFRRPVVPEAEPGHPAPVLADTEAALRWWEQHRAAVITATRLAAEHGRHDLAWRLPAIAQGYYGLRTRWADWLASNEIGLRSARLLGDRTAEAYLLNARGEALGRTHRLAESEECLIEALAIRRGLGDVLGELGVLIGLGTTVAQQDRYVEAAAYSRHALALARTAGNRTAESYALNNLGRFAVALGQHEEAMRYHQEYREICEETGDVVGSGRAVLRLAEGQLDTGDAKEALRLVHEAIPIVRAGGDRNDEAVAATDLGRALAALGEHTLAREQLRAALDLWTEIDPAEGARVRDLLADLSR